MTDKSGIYLDFIDQFEVQIFIDGVRGMEIQLQTISEHFNDYSRIVEALEMRYASNFYNRYTIQMKCRYQVHNQILHRYEGLINLTHPQAPSLTSDVGVIDVGMQMALEFEAAKNVSRSMTSIPINGINKQEYIQRSLARENSRSSRRNLKM